MAFLDNSGDIILDAVLTDTGRFRLAQGDGSFRIAKFAFGDDEIDYSLYNKNHPSGSAYYDLSILQTPILEAFTNNTSFLKSKLVSISQTNLLYLPVMKLNKNRTRSKMHSSVNLYTIGVDKDTLADMKTGNVLTDGVVNGTGNKSYGQGGFIRLDQGLDTKEIAASNPLDPGLIETQYLLEIDDRLGIIATGGEDLATEDQKISFNFKDDDQIASYYVTQTTNGQFVKSNTETKQIGTGADQAPGEIIKGPRGTYLQFKVHATTELQNSDYLFDRLGLADTANTMGFGATVKYIDTTVKVTGVSTGYRIDIPIRFCKKP